MPTSTAVALFLALAASTPAQLVVNNHGTLDWAAFREDARAEMQRYLAVYGAELGVDDTAEVREARLSRVFDDGRVEMRAYQQYRGLRVWGGYMRLEADTTSGTVIKATSWWASFPVGTSTDPVLSLDEAIGLATELFPTTVSRVHTYLDSLLFFTAKLGELPALAWKVELWGPGLCMQEPNDPCTIGLEYGIDANTGATLAVSPTILYFNCTCVPAAQLTAIGGDARPECARLHVAPNPFNSVATIRYSTVTRGRVSLAVYDLSGRVVRTLVDESRSAGEHTVAWRGVDDAGKSVASGVYVARLMSGGVAVTERVVLLR